MKCKGSDELYVHYLANEVENPLSLSRTSKEHELFYPIEDWFDQWLFILDNLDLENNQMEDFVELCNNIQCIKKDLSVCCSNS